MALRGRARAGNFREPAPGRRRAPMDGAGIVPHQRVSPAAAVPPRAARGRWRAIRRRPLAEPRSRPDAGPVPHILLALCESNLASRKSQTVTIRGTIVFAAGVLAALGAGWAGFPGLIYQTQRQPVDFSHQVHADKAGSKCDDCHSFRADGTFAGVPTLDKCSGCHAAAMGSTVAEKNFVDRYVTPGREPQWLVYARQPENVYFSHITHVKRGNLKCE